MTQDTTAFDAVLKEVYLGPIRSQLNAKTRLLSDFTKEDITQYEWEGRSVIVPLRKGRNVGTKASGEDKLLPAAGKQQYAKLTIPIRTFYGRIELTAQVMKASRSNKGAFTRAMQSEQEGIVDDISRQRNRILGYAGRGILGVVSSYANPTVTVKDPGGVVGTTNTVRFIKVGMVVAIHTGDSDTIRGIRTVATVASATTFTLDSDLSGTASGDLITLGATDGSTNEGSRDLEAVGLLGLADSSTYLATIHGIDRSAAANAFFRSTILSSVGALSPDILQRGIDNAEEVSGEVIDALYAHSSVRREVLKLTEADRRYTAAMLMAPDAGTKAGAFKADLTFNGIPIKVDKDFAYGIIVGCNKSHLFWIPEVEGEWADEDGSILLRSSTKDKYEARFRVFENFFSDKGNSLVRWDGVTATVSSGVYSD